MTAYEAWLAPARSALWFVRVRAGQELSFHAGQREVDAVLHQLLVAPGHTAVAARTADALLRSRDRAALRVFVSAWSVAEPSRVDLLSAALSGALHEASLVAEESRRLTADVRQLLTDDDERVRRGAALLVDRVTAALPQ